MLQATDAPHRAHNHLHIEIESFSSGSTDSISDTSEGASSFSRAAQRAAAAPLREIRANTENTQTTIASENATVGRLRRTRTVSPLLAVLSPRRARTATLQELGPRSNVATLSVTATQTATAPFVSTSEVVAVLDEDQEGVDTASPDTARDAAIHEVAFTPITPVVVQAEMDALVRRGSCCSVDPLLLGEVARRNIVRRRVAQSTSPRRSPVFQFRFSSTESNTCNNIEPNVFTDNDAPNNLLQGEQALEKSKTSSPQKKAASSLATEESNSSTETKKQETCRFCMEEFPTNSNVSACQCFSFICRSCLQSELQMQMRRGDRRLRCTVCKAKLRVRLQPLPAAEPTRVERFFRSVAYWTRCMSSQSFGPSCRLCAVIAIESWLVLSMMTLPLIDETDSARDICITVDILLSVLLLVRPSALSPSLTLLPPHPRGSAPMQARTLCDSSVPCCSWCVLPSSSALPRAASSSGVAVCPTGSRCGLL
ncbi:MAG: hypothetical protein MHM6MM_002605 [Cercozoa sp. M6MM]